MKRRLKQPETLFFAVTDQEDFVISLELSSGTVVVEQVGKNPHKKLGRFTISIYKNTYTQPIA